MIPVTARLALLEAAERRLWLSAEMALQYGPTIGNAITQLKINPVADVSLAIEVADYLQRWTP